MKQQRDCPWLEQSLWIAGQRIGPLLRHNAPQATVPFSFVFIFFLVGAAASYLFLIALIDRFEVILEFVQGFFILSHSKRLSLVCK